MLDAACLLGSRVISEVSITRDSDRAVGQSERCSWHATALLGAVSDAPLTLESAKEDTFLETTFRLKDNNLHYWLKNENTMANPNKIWRLHISTAIP